MTDSVSLEKGAKSWPGLLSLCAAVTAQYPPAHTFTLDDTEAEAVPSGLAIPSFVVPPDASGNELLSVAGRMVLASLLKQSHQKEWHLLFNSYAHGKSFATLYGKIANRGPTVTIVRISSNFMHACSALVDQPFTCIVQVSMYLSAEELGD